MKPNTNDHATCTLCDIWWILLIVFFVILAAVLTRDYWMPLIGLA